MGNTNSAQKQPSSFLKESFQEHENAINCIAISEDQSLLVAGSEDSTISMWSTKTAKTECLGKLEGHSAYITCLAIFDTNVVSGSADNTVKKWDMTTCECLYTFVGHTSRISRVLCTGDFIFSSSYDKMAKAWLFDVDEYDDEDNIDPLIRTFQGHKKAVFSMIFIPDEENVIKDQFQLNIRPKDTLITGSADCTAKMWSFESGDVLMEFVGHAKPISTMALNPAGNNLYTGSTDGDIRVWDLNDGDCIRILEGHSGPIVGLLVVNRLMYSGSTDGVARCWVTEFGDCTRIYKGHKHSVAALKFHNGVRCGDAVIRAFDAKTGQIVRTFVGHRGAVTCMIVVDKKLYSGSFDGTLKVWDTTGIEVRKNFNHEDEEEDEESKTLEEIKNKFRNIKRKESVDHHSKVINR